jgi:hypothetical protein
MLNLPVGDPGQLALKDVGIPRNLFYLSDDILLVVFFGTRGMMYVNWHQLKRIKLELLKKCIFNFTAIQ